jgi:hypothetical protein
MDNVRKLRSDSINSDIKSFENAILDIELPDGVELKNEDEYIIWRQFTRARAKSAWRDFDLVLLAKVVRLEYDIRKYQLRLDIDDAVIENKRGTPVVNPLINVIDTLQRQQLSIIRSMSLNSTGKDPRTLNESAKEEQKARELIKSNGIESLLAMPVSTH